MDERLTIRIPETLKERAKEHSAQTGVNLSFVLRSALQDWLAGRYTPRKLPNNDGNRQEPP